MFDTLTTYAANAAGSEFFAGGLALGAIGIAVGFTRSLWRTAFAFVARRVCVTVTVDNRLAEFSHLLNGLEAAGAYRRVRHFRLTWTRGHRGAAQASFVPALGTFWLFVDGHLVRFSREMSEKAKAGHSGTPLETLSLTLPFGGRSIVDALIAQGRSVQEQGKGGPTLYRYSDGYWRENGELVKRPVSTLVCEDDRIDRLLQDVRWFYGAQEWYVARSVPWRRGYLLHGPPGTGKSSVIRAIASELDLGLGVLDLGRQTLTDDVLCDALAAAPSHAVLVFEDVDAVFTARTGDGTGVSFSGLLNALDGLAAQEGRALFMTTNHIERLDPALIRPGRADLHVELGHVGAVAGRTLFLRFFPGEEALADRFAERIGPARLAPAALQGWLLAHADDAGAAAEADGLMPPYPIAAE